MTVPPVVLSAWPTPLQSAPRLATALGLNPGDVWIERKTSPTSVAATRSASSSSWPLFGHPSAAALAAAALRREP